MNGNIALFLYLASRACGEEMRDDEVASGHDVAGSSLRAPRKEMVARGKGVCVCTGGTGLGAKRGGSAD
jgi:hypothetical protein